jgi:hypothetical protein
MMAEGPSTPLAAGDRVRLLEARGGLRAGVLGTIVHYGTIKGVRSISPDPSGEAMYVKFDGVIGMLTIPTNILQKISS